MTVSGNSKAVIARKGTRITVGDRDKAPATCTGGVPTVLNTDRIDAQTVGSGFTDLEMHLAGGPFAPGATAEPVGASEIEVQFSSPGGIVPWVVGTAGADDWRWGLEGPDIGLNLNPGVATDEDVDVTAREDDNGTALVAFGGAGDDTIGAGQVPSGKHYLVAFGGEGDDRLSVPAAHAYGLVTGGDGNDTLTGGALADRLTGEGGADRILGNGGGDQLTGGAGRDRIMGGAGADIVRARDVSRDRVSCGSGRDRATIDRRDRVSGCERVSRG